MFGLREADLQHRILGCGDGPAGFNSELTRRGGQVISADPVYVFDAGQIRSRIAETYETVMTQMRENQDAYVWDSITSIEALGRIRMSAMEVFLSDYEAGKNAGRYVAEELPTLPFDPGSFDIALSSHFLFLYSNYLSAEFHVQALQEMLLVSREVRVFPLLTLAGHRSPYMDLVRDYFTKHGYTVDIRRVSYEFQRGGNEMLLIKPAYL